MALLGKHKTELNMIQLPHYKTFPSGILTPKDVYFYIYDNIIHNSQAIEITKMSIDK